MSGNMCYLLRDSDVEVISWILKTFHNEIICVSCDTKNFIINYRLLINKMCGEPIFKLTKIHKSKLSTNFDLIFLQGKTITFLSFTCKILNMSLHIRRS